MAINDAPNYTPTVTSYAEVWIEIVQSNDELSESLVTSYAEVWIEISLIRVFTPNGIVTSYAEVWIEILFHFSSF